MPTYDYQCNACNERHEIFQKITDDPIRKCPSCGKQKMQRLFGTGAAIVFKGSGFYQTDYRSDSYKKRAESEKPKSESSDKTESKTESKADSAKPSSDAATTPKKPKASDD